MTKYPPSHHRAKAVIKACVASGTGIEYMPDAPRFRYIPPADKALHHGPPSARGAIACGRGNVLKLKTWQPSKLDANPMYRIPMTDTDADEQEAKAAWADGDPIPLREWLARKPWRAATAANDEVQLTLDERLAA